MASFGHSLLLDVHSWDLTLDEGGNIRQTTGDYAVAQEVSNRIRLFTNDAYYDQDEGVPHFALDLSQRASEALVRSRYREAAFKVPGVTFCQVSDIYTENRTLHGTVTIRTENGGTAVVNI